MLLLRNLQKTVVLIKMQLMRRVPKAQEKSHQNKGKLVKMAVRKKAQALKLL